MKNYFTILFLISWTFLVRGDPGSLCVVGTGRGVITAAETAAGAYKLVERPYSRNTTDDDVDDSQLWYTTIADFSGPYGYFIVSDIYTTNALVWDINGASYRVGTEVIAYAMKNGLSQNQNQRWNQYGNQWEAIGAPTLAANVTPAGNVVLAKMVVGSPYQQFFFYPVYSDTSVEVFNEYNATVYLNYSTPVGSWQYALKPNENYTRALFSVSVIYITDVHGTPISPSPYSIYGTTNNAYVRVPAPAPLPTVARTWRGYFVVNATTHINANLTLTFIAEDSYISGSGSDTFGGNFTIYGTIYVDGGIFSFSRTYTSSSAADEFDGTLDGTSTNMTGSWKRTSGTPSYSNLFFQFILVAQ